MSDSTTPTSSFITSGRTTGGTSSDTTNKDVASGHPGYGQHFHFYPPLAPTATPMTAPMHPGYTYPPSIPPPNMFRYPHPPQTSYPPPQAYPSYFPSPYPMYPPSYPAHPAYVQFAPAEVQPVDHTKTNNVPEIVEGTTTKKKDSTISSSSSDNGLKLPSAGSSLNRSSVVESIPSSRDTTMSKKKTTKGTGGDTTSYILDDMANYSFDVNGEDVLSELNNNNIDKIFSFEDDPNDVDLGLFDFFIGAKDENNTIQDLVDGGSPKYDGYFSSVESEEFPNIDVVVVTSTKETSPEVQRHKEGDVKPPCKKGKKRKAGKGIDMENFRANNRKNSKKARLRKKIFIQSLQKTTKRYEVENTLLRNYISDNMGVDPNEVLRTEMDKFQSNSGMSTSEQLVFHPKKAEEDNQVTTLQPPDFRLVKSLQDAKQNFLITNPNLPDEPIVYCSTGFIEMTGYSREEIVGRNCRFLQGPLSDRETIKKISKAVKAGKHIGTCIVNYKKDGTAFWNYLFLSPLHDANGNVIMNVGVQCEIPEEKASLYL